MSLQLIVENLDLVPEAVRGEYTEKNGKFYLNVTGMEDNWPKKEAALIAERDAAEGALVTERLANALTRGKVNPEVIGLLTERLNQRVRLKTVNGERTMFIMQTDGKTPMLGSGRNVLATFDDLAEEARRRWPSMFERTDTSESTTPKATGNSLTRKEFDALTVRDGFRSSTSWGRQLRR